MPHRHILLKRLALAGAALALAACATTQTQTAANGPAPDDRLNATLWMQQAVEYKANAEAVYALAELRLEEALADKTWTAAPGEQKPGYETLPPAIILDADETVLDNSPYQAWMVKTGAGYSSASWNAWAGAGKANAVPGAVDFTNAAAAKGVTVFYVTNRSHEVEEGTARNLDALGFPMGDKTDTLMTKGEKPDWTSAKGTRRAAVAENYRILLLLGDNFGDFTDDYDGGPQARRAVYEANAAHWGRDWLMLPNPAYGSWESAAFGGDYSLSPEEQRRRKVDALKGWRRD
ncbi:5'-nucleotidase, lipoprotein e(P4) family [Hyphococcus luteus]|uniref:5-nucleotide phosphatase n=1 Tax=Hyphococcus luteus TaxID=2058213 RepID=A0A2S7K8E5_9PROT|nr:HAD family acid phosphatase [Marinicaulis flavus]PQA88748.1 5-nucleotide phosphatase [Marinicaulis flavus]